ncbi:MAG: SDR family oxidoreductase [Anaerolineales bacterium]|nr:SDR family oxidoreductase [Anaerolineales bacterium]
MTHYLVTGGAGFIGSHLVHTLLVQGADVRVLDNFSTGKRENLTGLAGNLEVLEGDVRDRATVEKALRDVDVVFHQAAFVSVPESMEKPQICFDVNVTATVALFDAARSAGVRRVVVASSAAVYGESDALPLKETTPTQSISPYAASKRTIEIYAQMYTKAFGLDVVALRYFNVYGPRQRPDSMYAAAVPIFVRRLLDGEPVTIFGDGGQTRDLINIRDVVRANLIAAEHPKAPGQVFNVCTGQETRILDLLEVLFDLFPGVQEPVFADPRPGDIYRSVGSAEFIAQMLGFQAEVTLEEGLRETVAWMQA